MNKVLIFMLCLILSGMAMLGCSNGSEEGDVPELASVNFGFMDGSENVIGISREALSDDNLYWSYTAAWKGDAGVTPEGAQSEKKAVKDGAGLAELGGFTPGSWEFELFGYSDSERTKLVLSGKSGTAVLSAGSKTQVDVDVDYNTDGTGTIKLGEITFKEGTGYTLESITVDGGTEQITNLSDNQLTDIAAGSHTVYLKYSGSGGYYEANVLITVSAGVTTVIEGQLDLLVAAAPTGLTGVKPSYYGQADGKIAGLDTGKTYQYSAAGGSIWTDAVADSDGKITGLAAGDYKVRINGVRPGTTVDVTVPAGDFRITLCAGEGSGDDIYEYVAAGTEYNLPECPFTFTAPKIPVGAVNEGEDIPFRFWNAGTISITSAKIELNDNITLIAQWAKPVFSVSDTRKVYFAKGNLQAVFESAGSEKTWKFAENQYDYIGDVVANAKINGNGSVSEEGTVDLFGWSTAATDYGINNSIDYNTYSGDFKDWGTAIGDGNTWSTLSKAEMGYLFNTRTSSTVGTTDNARYAKVKVDEKAGILIFPDVFTWTENMGTAPANCNIENTAWTGVATYTTAQFEAMESAGVVFLPAAGRRYSSGVSDVGFNGRYWSATSGLYYGNSAYDLCFDDYDVDPANNSHNRYFGLSVRLVRGE